jgi:hypothetical protein
MDVLAWNRAAGALFTDFAALPAARRNYVSLLFTDPAVRGLHHDWRRDARDAVAALRMQTRPTRPTRSWPCSSASSWCGTPTSGPGGPSAGSPAPPTARSTTATQPRLPQPTPRSSTGRHRTGSRQCWAHACCWWRSSQSARRRARPHRLCRCLSEAAWFRPGGPRSSCRSRRAYGCLPRVPRREKSRPPEPLPTWHGLGSGAGAPALGSRRASAFAIRHRQGGAEHVPASRRRCLRALAGGLALPRSIESVQRGWVGMPRCSQRCVCRSRRKHGDLYLRPLRLAERLSRRRFRGGCPRRWECT